MMKNKEKILILVILILLIPIIPFFIKKEETTTKNWQHQTLKNPPIIEEEKTYSFDDAINSIKEEEIKENLKYIASDELEGRMTGKKGNVKAAEFLKNYAEKYGLNTEYHKFTSSDIGKRISGINKGPNNEVGDDFSQNVYAWIDGNEFKNEIIVVGAHFDHVGYGPTYSRSRTIAVHNGADDNGSGTVGLMAVAKAFSFLKGKTKRTIVFQFYSAEEMGLLGSRFYCSHPTFPKSSPSMSSHIAMINMDMIGHLKNYGENKNLIDASNSIDMRSFVSKLESKYSFAKSISIFSGGGGSDHSSFYNKKVPIVFLFTGMHQYYHTPSDDLDTVNCKGIEQIAKFAFELAWDISQQDSKPMFDENNFKPTVFTADHE